MRTFVTSTWIRVLILNVIVLYVNIEREHISTYLWINSATIKKHKTGWALTYFCNLELLRQAEHSCWLFIVPKISKLTLKKWYLFLF